MGEVLGFIVGDVFLCGRNVGIFCGEGVPLDGELFLCGRSVHLGGEMFGFLCFFVGEVFICSLALRQQHCSYPALLKNSCFALLFWP